MYVLNVNIIHDKDVFVLAARHRGESSSLVSANNALKSLGGYVDTNDIPLSAKGLACKSVFLCGSITLGAARAVVVGLRCLVSASDALACLF